MNKYIIKGLATLMVGVGLASCSDGYLDVAPITTLDAATASATVEGANLALNGVCRSMNTQYQSISITPNFNGESWYATFYGDMLGSDAFYWMWANRVQAFYNWDNNIMVNGVVPGYAWRYPYILISQCNNILVGETTAEGDAAERASVMAQARTIRAHAYIRLVQCFAPRWEDSNNGEYKCIVLRKTPGTEDLPLSSMKEVLDFIYEDLDRAIELYNTTGVTKSNYIWRPNINVAKGLYARAAMIRHDYAKAQKMAHEAREGYPIMSAKEYKDGFCEANGEWMWANSLDDQIYYWAFGSWYACNGPYPTLWLRGAGAINYDLARQIPVEDCRAQLFFTPEVSEYYGYGASRGLFWNANAVDPTTMNCLGSNGRMREAVRNMCVHAIPNQDKEKFGEAYTNRTGEDAGSGSQIIPFGAQFKFWCVDTYGRGQFPFMRAAEFLLTEAEAAYRNSDETTAKNCINELLAKRNPNQTCSSTGDALLEEIRLQRRIELWGEGHSWFDLKRWNLPMVRKTWEASKRDSNNIPAAYGITKDPSDQGWVFVTPQSETDYNHAINR